ncbi:MAG: rhomboid family intramembrane serine protease [Odoribacter sp.]
MYYKEYGGNYSEGILEGFKNSFRKGSSLTRLIYINCGVFLGLKIVYVLMLLTGVGDSFYPTVLEWIGVPADLEYLLYRPWSLFTYMFTQFEFLHLLFNMLWLYWFGSFFLNHFSEKSLTGVYLLGGLAGALLYVGAYNVFPYFDQLTRLSSWAIGSSASVMAIVFAVCTYLPHQKVYIFLIGPVKLIYLALFTALIDVLSIQSGNAGGHIAHLGGALFGWLFILGIQRNRNITSGVIHLFSKSNRWFSRKRSMRVKHTKNVSAMNDREYNEYKRNQNDKMNKILDKISQSGYESLSREEKEILFRSGKN